MPSYLEQRGFCRTCNRPSLIRRKGVNHVLHLLLTLVTLGLWLPVWVVLSAMNNERSQSGWRCAQCGSKTKRDVSSIENATSVVLVVAIAAIAVWVALLIV